MRFLTVEEFTEIVGLDELSQIAGYGNLNDPAGRSLQIDKIEEAIAFVEELFIGYARGRYPVIETLTIEATPKLVKGHISDVARYRLRSRPGGQGQVAEAVKQRHDAAIEFWRLVAAGKAELPIAGQPINAEAGSAKVGAIIPPSPVPGMLRGW